MNLPLSTPINIVRLDGGRSEQGRGYRNFSIEPFGLSDKFAINVSTSLSITYEDETTLVPLDNGNPYDFAASNAGDQFEEILSRLTASGGVLRLLAEGVLDLDTAAVKVFSTDLKVASGGAVLPLPLGYTGVSLEAEIGMATDYVRYTLNGTNPDHATFLGSRLFDQDKIEIGLTPNGNIGDIAEIANFIALRSGTWTSGVVHVKVWGY